MFEGLGPSPDAIRAWEDGRAAREEASEGPPPTIEEQLANERERSARLERELRAARGETEGWIRAASSIMNMLMLSPHQNKGYATMATRMLQKALSQLGFVTGLRYCDCSFPASDASRPEIVLKRWKSLQDSEWDVAWTPAWTAEACVDGSRGISFTTLLKVSGIAIAGRVRLKFEADGSALAVSFLEAPAFRCDVACHVTLGQVPMPIQAELGRVVRDEAIRWLTEKMVAPNEHVRRADSSLTSRGDAAAAGRGESVETHRSDAAAAGRG